MYACLQVLSKAAATFLEGRLELSNCLRFQVALMLLQILVMLLQGGDGYVKGFLKIGLYG